VRKNSVTQVEYDLKTGEVLSQYQGFEMPIPSTGKGIAQSDTLVDCRTQYIDVRTKTVKDKNTFSVPETKVSGLFVMELPVGTTAVWQDETYLVNDGCIEITLDQIGRFPLRLRHPAYIGEEVIIENQQAY